MDLEGELYVHAAHRHELNANRLDDGCILLTGQLPVSLVLDGTRFGELWGLHPADFHVVKIGGRLVRTPRWQQAYGRDYAYTGQINKALPVPALLAPMLAWAQAAIDARLNGILVNWYDGDLRHYIGRHRDSTKNLCEGAPIVTLSFGAERVFRLRPWCGNTGPCIVDHPASNGALFVMPWDTNLKWTHEVPKSVQRGRRISVTFRAFEDSWN